ncbi:MAG: VacJ family lipoprotein [Parvibaculaceae bacterium]
MLRTVVSRKDWCQRRMMLCVCCAALLTLLPAGASAERRTESAAFTGTVLSLVPNEEHGRNKKKKKQVAAKAAKSKQAFKIDLAQRVIVEPAAAVPGVDVVDGVQVPKDLGETGDVPGDPEDVPGDLVEAQDDPLEGFNRAMFGFNEVVDHLVFEPAARVYRAVIPRPVRTGVANVLTNLASPITLTNDILQGNPEAAANTIKRFMVNSTLGLGGLFDHATGLGEPLHREDFGQTLGAWGVGGSPYIVLPLLGPSNPRDMIGKVADTAVNPMTWILYDEDLWARSIPVGVEVVSGREAILDDYDNLRKNSPDLYASVRDLYAQKRQAEIANEAAGYSPGAGVSSLPPASIPQSLNPY